MANGENAQLIMDLLRIGAKYLLPIAKSAFYEYRDRILEAEKVSPEERASLLDWMNATDLGGGSQPDEPDKPEPEPELEPEPPVPPPSPTTAPYMTFQPPPIPNDAELLTRGYKVGDAIVPATLNDDTSWWLVVRKGQPLLGMVPLRTIGQSPE